MPISRKTRLRGAIKIVAVPAAFLFVLVFPFPTELILLFRLIVGLFFMMYVFLFFLSDVKYDSKRTLEVDLSEYSETIKDFAVAAAKGGYPICRALLAAIGPFEEVNQSKLCERVREQGCQLKANSIRPYIKELGERGLLQLKEDTNHYEILCSLTEEGQRAKRVYAHLFPENNLMFTLRNELGIRGGL